MLVEDGEWWKDKKYIVILIINENVYGWCLVVHIYIYIYYVSNNGELLGLNFMFSGKKILKVRE